MAERQGGIPLRRVIPLKPSLRGMGNWSRAQVRQAGYSGKALWRLVLSGLFILCLAIYCALWMSGSLPKVKQSLTDFKTNRLISMGFVVKTIDVVGDGRLSESDVRKALSADTGGIYEGQYFFATDLEAAKTRVKSLGWVDNVVIRRLWPNRIVVEIFERDVYALWQNQGVIHVVDSDGHVITGADVTAHMGLPHFIGEGSFPAAIDLIDVLGRHDTISGRFKTFRRVSDSRWDIMDEANGLTVKLPVDHVEYAIDRLKSCLLYTSPSPRDA